MPRNPLLPASLTPPSRTTQMADAIRLISESRGEPATSAELELNGFTPDEIENLGPAAAQAAHRRATRQTDADWRQAAA